MADLDKAHARKLAVLFAYFCMLAYLMWGYDVGYAILPALVLSAAAWLGYECSRRPKIAELRSAAAIGMLLSLFDFGVQNLGALLGFWQVTGTALHVGYVPVEIILLALIGGTAWALAQPKSFSRLDSILDIALFSTFGMLGEALLVKNGIMRYAGGWNPACALLGYIATWCLMTCLRYAALAPKGGRKA